MTREDFEQSLREVKPGQGVRLPYDVYEILFPPGERDEQARGGESVAERVLASVRGSSVPNHPDAVSRLGQGAIARS